MTEWSDAIRNAIVVVVIVAIMGMVFGLVYIGMNSNQRAQETLGDTLGAMTEKEFTQYNGTNVSGTEVIGALKSFSQRDIIIGIQTKALGKVAYYNRSCTVNTSGGEKWTLDYPSTPPTTLDDTEYTITGAATAKGGYKHPLTIGAAISKNTNLYVVPTETFTATIMRDTNQTVVGIKFVQN